VKLPGWYGLVLAAAVAVSAAGLALAAAPAALAAPAATAKPVLVDCASHGDVKPKNFTLACADGNDFLAKLSWSHWAATASGTGTEEINTCQPSCVAGHVKKYGVTVALLRVRPRPHTSQRYYTRMKLTYTGKVPKGFHRHRTIKLWASI